MSMENIIEIHGLDFAYEGGQTVLENVDLTIRTGESAGIIGPNGGGKSTLLKLIMREEVPTSGNIYVGDFSLTDMKPKEVPYLRRTMGISTETKARRLVFDRLVIDMDAFELTVSGKKVDIPPKEMELLFYLASSPNRVYTRNQLLDEVWGFDYFGDSRTVDVHVKRLREKLEGVSEKWSLKTVWGVGYKFEVL